MGFSTFPNNPFPPSSAQFDEGKNEFIQAEIDAIKDGTNIDSFGDVENALALKANTADVNTALATKTNLSNIAPAFDATSGVYAVDDKVIYNGVLYEFTSAHSTAGEWDESEVQPVKISELIDSLKSGLTNLVKVYHATGTTDSVGDFIFSVPNDGTLIYVRPLRDAEYYNSWWGVILASTGNNVGHSAKAIKDDNTVLASQAVKFDVYYI